MRNRVIKTVLIGIACFALSVARADETVTVYTQNHQPREAFILFYMASCPHCRRFDPVLKDYAVKHHIPVLAYTLDGRTVASFPQSVLPSQQELNRFFPRGNPVVPTLFLMNVEHHNIMPVLQGEATAYQLDRRLQHIHAWDEKDVH